MKRWWQLWLMSKSNSVARWIRMNKRCWNSAIVSRQGCSLPVFVYNRLPFRTSGSFLLSPTNKHRKGARVCATGGLRRGSGALFGALRKGMPLTAYVLLARSNHRLLQLSNGFLCVEDRKWPFSSASIKHKHLTTVFDAIALGSMCASLLRWQPFSGSHLRNSTSCCFLKNGFNTFST